MEIVNQNWHTLSTGEAASVLGVDLDQGLSAKEVERRQAQFGANELRERPPRTFWQRLLEPIMYKHMLLLQPYGGWLLQWDY